MITLLDIRDYFRKVNEELRLAPNFIFTGDEQGLRSVVETYGDDYMFVDYGEISSHEDGQNRLLDTMNIAVVLAHPFGANSVTPDHITGKASDLLLRIKSLHRRMYADQHCVPWLRYVSASTQTTPFAAPDIKRSIGWVLEFEITGYDLFDVRVSARHNGRPERE